MEQHGPFGMVAFHCNGRQCRTERAFLFGRMTDALEQLKREGWRVARCGHVFCPRCVKIARCQQLASLN